MRFLIGDVQAVGNEFAEVPDVFVWRITKESTAYLRSKIAAGLKLMVQDPDVLYVQYQLPAYGSWHQAELPKLADVGWLVTTRLSGELRRQVRAKEESPGVRCERMVLQREGAIWFTAYEKYGGADFETLALYREQQRELLGI
jgi:hypothetical protein